MAADEIAGGTPEDNEIIKKSQSFNPTKNARKNLLNNLSESIDEGLKEEIEDYQGVDFKVECDEFNIYSFDRYRLVKSPDEGFSNKIIDMETGETLNYESEEYRRKILERIVDEDEEREVEEVLREECGHSNALRAWRMFLSPPDITREQKEGLKSVLDHLYQYGQEAEEGEAEA